MSDIRTLVNLKEKQRVLIEFEKLKEGETGPSAEMFFADPANAISFAGMYRILTVQVVPAKQHMINECV